MAGGTVAGKKERICGFKKEKDRVSLFHCINQTGTSDGTPLMIGNN